MAAPKASGGFAVVFVLIAAAMVFVGLIGSSFYLNNQSDTKTRNAAGVASQIGQLTRNLAQLPAGLVQAREHGGNGGVAADVDSINHGFTALLDGSATAATAVNARTRIDAAYSTWKPLGQTIHDAQGRAALTTSFNALIAAEPDMLKNLDAATTETQRASDAENAQLQNYRTIIAVVAVLVFVVILFVLLRRINSSRERVADYAASLEARNTEVMRAANELAESKAGTDRILNTVTQGLFLMGPDYKIDGEYSKELEVIFRSPELRAFNVLNLLQRILTDRMFNTTRDYFGLLFDTTKKERTVLQVNPLTQVEVNFANSEGGYTSRYLSFVFRRIVVDDAVARVFVAVNDVTERVELEQQLRLAEASKDRQFEFLLGVLHVGPADLDDFLTTTRDQLSVMNTALRTQDFAAATVGQMSIFRQRLETVFRSVHTIKGNAQTLKFSHFVNLCHSFETKLVALRNRSALGGDDFLAVVIAQSELAKDVEELAEVRGRFVAVNTTPDKPRAGFERRATDLITSVANLVESTAQNQGKKARLEAVGFETTRLSDDVRRSVRDVLIQFARNSVTHGVEAPEDRISAGKLPVATLTIATKPDAPADQFAFTFRDDGRGLDPDAIKARAVKSGLITAEEAAAMKSPQTIGLIFRPGFSTAEAVTEDAGRGFGMNIIKEIVVDQLGGKMTVRTEAQHFTEFTVSIPINAEEAQPERRARREEVPA